MLTLKSRSADGGSVAVVPPLPAQPAGAALGALVDGDLASWGGRWRRGVGRSVRWWRVRQAVWRRARAVPLSSVRGEDLCADRAGRCRLDVVTDFGDHLRLRCPDLVEQQQFRASVVPVVPR